MLSLLASFAQEESRSISENARWAIQKRFEKGIPNGHFRVYGYRWEDDQLVPVPEEAAIVKRIYSAGAGPGGSRHCKAHLPELP